MMEATTLARCTGARLDRAQRYVDAINEAMSLYGIDTPIRQAMFLANVGHESGGLHYSTELWGPTLAQEGYEGRKDLGNTQPGDGVRFRGHGLIQTTGRYNHAAVRDRLRVRFPDRNVPDFEREPDERGARPRAERAHRLVDPRAGHDLGRRAVRVVEPALAEPLHEPRHGAPEERHAPFDGRERPRRGVCETLSLLLPMQWGVVRFPVESDIPGRSGSLVMLWRPPPALPGWGL